LLKAAGATLAVPVFLQSSFAEAASAPPPLVLLMQTNGTHQESFWPAPGTFNSIILDKLLTNPVLAPKATLLKGINYKPIGNPSGNGHDQGFHGLYSGFDSISGPGGSFGGGISLDQRLASEANFASARLRNIYCGVHVTITRHQRRPLPFSATGPPSRCQVSSISTRSTRVFGPATATRRRSKKRVYASAAQVGSRRGGSRSEALQKRLGPIERQKIDTHLTALRDFENRLSASTGPISATCASLKPSQTGVPTTGQGNEANAQVLERLFMEFIANTVACKMVGVLSLQFGRGGDHFHYAWLNIPGMPSDAQICGPRTRRREHRADQHRDRAYTDGLIPARLAAFRRPTARPPRRLLIVWGNEAATGPHGMKDIPVVLIGGAGGGSSAPVTWSMRRTAAPATRDHLTSWVSGQRVWAFPDSASTKGSISLVVVTQVHFFTRSTAR
jgi:hypothetical protein